MHSFFSHSVYGCLILCTVL